MIKYVVPHSLFLLLLISFKSINVMECPEFCSLLLLMRSDLSEKDIPHRTKLRESIIKMWEAWFQTLKTDLSVCLIIIMLVMVLTLNTISLPLEKYLLQLTCGLTTTIDPIFALLCTGSVRTRHRKVSISEVHSSLFIGSLATTMGKVWPCSASYPRPCRHHPPGTYDIIHDVMSLKTMLDRTFYSG